jgi:predicted ester cyclase
MTKGQAEEFASHWIAAWNSHDLEKIMSHYEDSVLLTSPVAAKLLNNPSGTVRGKEALRAYFKKGLEVYPDLNFRLVDLMWGLNSVVLCYVNQKGTKAAEFMDIGSNGKVLKVVANYNV